MTWRDSGGSLVKTGAGGRDAGHTEQGSFPQVRRRSVSAACQLCWVQLKQLTPASYIVSHCAKIILMEYPHGDLRERKNMNK